MKRAIYILMIFTFIALMSCRKEGELGVTPDTETSSVTFNLSTIEAATRTLNITRYIMEVYKTSDLNTRIQRVEQGTGTIVVSLETNINYTCLFWADEVAPNDNSTGTYNAGDLKSVTLNSGKIMQEAFFAKTLITIATTPSFGVTLKRATAKVNFVETDIVEASKDLAVTFDQYPGFNASTGDVTGTAASITKTFNSTVTAGTLGTLLTFASVTGINTNFTTIYDAAATNTMPSTPLKANYITNIRGTYAIGYNDFVFTVEVDNGWVDIMQGVHINVGTTEAPSWIKVADRNAEKDGLFGATAGNSETDSGDYYAWSNASNDAANEDKAYRACFDFGNGNGSWRLPTEDEWAEVSGGGTNNNANRKIQLDSDVWRLYDERTGHTADYVNFPMSGYKQSNGTLVLLNDAGFYWTSIPDGSYAIRLGIRDYGFSYAGQEYKYNSLSVRCVKNVDN